MKQDHTEELRRLPKVDALVESTEGTALQHTFARARIVDAIREELERLRQMIIQNADSWTGFDEVSFFTQISMQLARGDARNLRRVINATGIVIHTNLGRAPLATEAIDAIRDTAAHYSNLEFECDTGKRGSRYSHIEELICSLTGAEAAVVVNNNAAAVLLVLNTLAQGSEVIISRGELVEIGGSFRIPDVISRSGAKLIEVGATNRTRIADYESAITEATRVLLKVHPSNFRMVGFTEETSRENLASLARERDLTLVEDLGSGTLIDLRTFGLPHETTVQEVVASGVDVVTFSGDKLLGGPQAGVIIGRREHIETIRKNPLIRALRIDKLSLAAFEATLRLYEDPDWARARLPIYAMLAPPEGEIAARAELLRAALQEFSFVEASVVDGESMAGGGSLPGNGIPTRLVELRFSNCNLNEALAALRANDPPVIARIANDALVLDVRTLRGDDTERLIAAVQRLSS